MNQVCPSVMMLFLGVDNCGDCPKWRGSGALRGRGSLTAGLLLLANSTTCWNVQLIPLLWLEFYTVILVKSFFFTSFAIWRLYCLHIFFAKCLYQQTDRSKIPHRRLARFLRVLRASVLPATQPSWHTITKLGRGPGSQIPPKAGLPLRSRRRLLMGTRCNLCFHWKMGRFVWSSLLDEAHPIFISTRLTDQNSRKSRKPWKPRKPNFWWIIILIFPH